jgi:hypothetical protein
MVRLLPSVAALLAATTLAAPALAADYGSDGGGQATDPGFSQFRDSYPTEPGDWAGLGDQDDPLKFDFGVRYWYSMGGKDFGANGGTASSKDTSHIGELHMRVEDHSTNTYASAIAGYSVAIDGDYSGLGGSGSIGDGHIGYVGADLGWNAFGDNHGTGVGPLVGYMYWQDSPNTGRNNFTTQTPGSTVSYDHATGQTTITGDSASNEVNIQMLRLGVQGKANLGDFFDISGEVVGVPYANVSGTVGADDPTFNTAVYGGLAQDPYGAEHGNISDMRSSPTAIDGWGYGAMAEAWLGIHPTKNMTVRFGGRAWYLQGTVDETYSKAHITNPANIDNTSPDYEVGPTVTGANFIRESNPFSLFRYGLMAELSYTF